LRKRSGTPALKLITSAPEVALARLVAEAANKTFLLVGEAPDDEFCATRAVQAAACDRRHGGTQTRLTGVRDGDRPRPAWAGAQPSPPTATWPLGASPGPW